MAGMKLVAGLGNPGREYEGTPHNVGFQVVDLLMEKLEVSGFQQKFHSQFCRTSIEGEACILIKPQTFMNRVGLAVAECAGFYEIPAENIVIISDDLDLPPGMARSGTVAVMGDTMACDPLSTHWVTVNSAESDLVLADLLGNEMLSVMFWDNGQKLKQSLLKV
jgi:hypothetical protein